MILTCRTIRYARPDAMLAVGDLTLQLLLELHCHVMKSSPSSPWLYPLTFPFSLVYRRNQSPETLGISATILWDTLGNLKGKGNLSVQASHKALVRLSPFCRLDKHTIESNAVVAITPRPYDRSLVVRIQITVCTEVTEQVN